MRIVGESVGKLAFGMALATAIAGGATAAQAQATPWDGEWEGTIRHSDLPCSPCKVRLTVSGGQPSVRAATAVRYVTIATDGAVVAEVPINIAGNAVQASCRMFGKMQTGGTLAAQGSCGNYSTQAEMALRRVSGAPPESTIAALPAPSQPQPPPPQPQPPIVTPVATPAPSPPPNPALAPSPTPSVPSNFGAGTLPVRLGAMSFGIEPGAVIGWVTTGSWLSACGSSGRQAPLKHKAGVQPNTKIVSDEFQRVLSEAGYTPRVGAEASASYLLVGKITSMTMTFCVRENTRPIQSSGSGSATVEWNVVSLATGISAYQMTTLGAFELPVGERSTEGSREVFAGIYRDALRRVAAETGFRNALAGAASAAVAQGAGEPPIGIRTAPRYANGITANMDKILPSVVEVKNSSGLGTAFVVDSRGYLLTNAHVVGSAETVTVRFNDGLSVDAKVLRRDSLRDIALLKVERSGLRPIPIRTGKLTLTEKVFAIGNPLGLSQTVTDGIVSAYRQFPQNAQEYIQASVNITFGNSGGPLLDANGNAVGVSVSGRAGGTLGLNFFIPIESALQRLDLKLGG